MIDEVPQRRHLNESQPKRRFEWERARSFSGSNARQAQLKMLEFAACKSPTNKGVLTRPLSGGFDQQAKKQDQQYY